MKILIRTVFLLCISAAPLQQGKCQLGQSYFSGLFDFFGHGFSDIGLEALPLGFSKYLVYSSSKDTFPGDTSGYVFASPTFLVLNWAGDLEIKKTFRFGNQHFASLLNNTLVKTNDGGYALGGMWIRWTSDYSDAFHGQFILKLDANLDSTWMSLDSGMLIANRTQTVCGMVQTPDSGFLIAGIDDQERITFTRFDAIGTKLWHKLGSSLGNSLVKSFHALPTGEFFLCGMKAGRAYVAVLDDSCDVVWERNLEFDGMNTNVACGVPRERGGYFFGYYRLDEFYPQYADMEFTWLSHNLKVTQNQRLCIPRDQWIQEVIEMEDGSMVVSGRTGHLPGSDNSSRSFLLKFSPTGDLLWFNKYHWYSPGTNINYDVSATPDGGFLLVGTSHDSTSTSPYSDTWVLKVDSVGCPFPGCTPGTWVEEAQEEATDVVAWPNPASDILQFRNEGDLYEAGTLTLFSPEGKVLEQVLMPQGFQETSLELTPYPQGTYFWQYTRASGTRSGGKVMVRR